MHYDIGKRWSHPCVILFSGMQQYVLVERRFSKLTCRHRCCHVMRCLE